MASPLARILDHRIIAVLRSSKPLDVERIADVLVSAGIRVLEVTLTTPRALAAVQRLADRDDLLVGTGSVRSLDDLTASIDAGARFYASPVLDEEVVAAARDQDLIAIPGALTPNEIIRADRTGADIVKLFPSPADAPSYIRSIIGPLPDLRLAPSGGVTSANAGALLDAGAVALNVGSWLTPGLGRGEPDYEEMRRRGEELVGVVGGPGRGAS